MKETKARSKLTQDQFERMFVEQVQQGNPWETWIPFYLLSKRNGHYKYYGQYKDSKFELTENEWLFPSGVIVEGKYVDTAARIVQFSIRFIPVLQIYMWVTMAGIFILPNVAMVTLSVDEPITYIQINLLVGFLIGVLLVMQRFKLRRISRKFMEEFELTES